MEKEPILTKGILEAKMVENPRQQFKGFFQYLHLRQDTRSGNPITIVTISDGVFSREFILFGTNEAKAKNKLEKYCIVEADVMYHQDYEGVQLLVQFQIVNKEIDYQIGNPILLTKGIAFGESASQIKRSSIRKSQISQRSQNNQRKRKSSRNRKRSIDTQQFLEKQQRQVLQTQYNPKPRFNQIRSLNLFDITFRIRGRVVKKSELIEYNKKDNSVGTLFNLLIVDETGDISGVFFGEKAKQFYGQILLGQCYSFKGGNLIEKTKYTNSSNNIEIQFTDKVMVHPIDDESIFPLNYLNYVKFKDLFEQKEKEKFDLICLCKQKEEVMEIQKKDGTTSNVQKLILFDNNYETTITLWDHQIEKFKDLKINTIFGLTDVIVKKQNRLQIYLTQNSKIDLNIPLNSRYLELHKWWSENNHKDIKLPTLNQLQQQKNDYEMDLSTLADVLEFGENCELGDVKYFNVYVNLVGYPSKLFYMSCVNDNCKKKVDGQPPYKCFKCDQKYDVPKPRMIGSFQFSDDVNIIYALVGSNQNCKILFQMSEQELYDTMVEKQELFNDFIETKLFDTYKVKIKACKTFYKDEPKPNYQVTMLKKIEDSCQYYTKVLLKQLLNDMTFKENN